MKKKPFSKVSKALYASLVLFTPFTAANANTLGADSVYTFTPVSAEANNVIKQAVYNSADNSVTYNYSRLDLTNPDRDNTNHFGCFNTFVTQYGLCAVSYCPFGFIPIF